MPLHTTFPPDKPGNSRTHNICSSRIVCADPRKIVGRDLLDELGHVDTRRTTFCTWRIITKQTTVRIHQRRIPRLERGMDIAEILRILRIVSIDGP